MHVQSVHGQGREKGFGQSRCPQHAAVSFRFQRVRITADCNGLALRLGMLVAEDEADCLLERGRDLNFIREPLDGAFVIIVADVVATAGAKIHVLKNFLK